jgi:selenocysteine lyase/cysteine desulfurase
MSTASRLNPDLPVASLRDEIVGIGTCVPVLDGTERPYVFLDNAASTPAFRHVLNALVEYVPWYSGVHRGTGFKSLLSTALFDGAHDAVGRFVGADLSVNTVIFTKNTTEGINKLANRFAFRRGDVVITSLMEHHSNDLPWRKHAAVVHIGVGPDGRLDVAALRAALQKHAGKARLVAINGASNISGLCSPLGDIARWTHGAGALLFVDAAQLAPHRPIRMLADDDPAHIDFLALSAHKMYAPFGTGALVGPKRFFEDGDPDAVGGGVVEVVTLEKAVWNHPPHKEEAGSPNVPGGIALAAAIDMLQRTGMEAIAEHEHALLTYAYGKLKAIRGLQLYGPTDNLHEKVGVITFNVEGMHHALTAAILGVEGGIGVRNGCFCAHPYVKELLHVTPEDDRRLTAEVVAGNKSNMPGMVRASLGCFNNREDVDRLVEMLERVVHKEYRGTYRQDRASGAFTADGFAPDFSRYFRFASSMMPGEGRGVSEAS